MYYTVYKVTNKLNGHIYIGAHQTEDLDDKYLGSGHQMVKVVKAFGRDNFTKEILHIFDNPNDMYKMEEELVNQEFVIREDTYNLRRGGIGGFDHIHNHENHLDWIRVGTQKRLDNMKDPVYAKAYNLKVSKGLKRFYETNDSPFLGKAHTDETKAKIGAITSKAQKGKGNSQYGTCWVYSLAEKINKKIKKIELKDYTDNGWIKGRKMKF